MLPVKRDQYAKYPQGGAVGEFADGKKLVSNLTAMDWTPTIVNPLKPATSGVVFCLETTGLAWLHILMWAVAVIFSAAVNFRIDLYMPNATNASGHVDASNPYGEGASDSTQVIGFIGGISSIVGVLLLVGAAAFVKAKEYNSSPFLNFLIQLLTSLGTVTTFYTFCLASQNVESIEWWFTLIGVIAGSWAQVTLYATSSMIDVEMMPRAFVPSLAVSVQFISAVAITGDQFMCSFTGGTYEKCTASQKFIAILVPIFTAVGALLMFGIRKILTNMAGPENQRSNDFTTDLKNRPFLRSLILLFYFVGAILAVYKVAMMQAGWDPVAYMFTVLGMLLNFVIVGIVFVPGAEKFTTGRDEALLGSE